MEKISKEYGRTSQSTSQGEKRRKVNEREKNLFILFTVKSKLQWPVGTYSVKTGFLN